MQGKPCARETLCVAYDEYICLYAHGMVLRNLMGYVFPNGICCGRFAILLVCLLPIVALFSISYAMSSLLGFSRAIHPY
jgi:hypothetical protein